MNTKRIAMLVILGTCILGLTALGSKKNPVPRPFKAVLHQTVVITFDVTKTPPVPVSWELSGIGQVAHLGRSENKATGTYDALGNPVGTGVTTAANGDQVWWSGGDPSFITGGTGRFEGATGIIKGVSQEIVFRPDPPPGTLVADMVLVNEGTITY